MFRTNNLALHKGEVSDDEQRLDHMGMIVAKAEDVFAWESFLKEQGVTIAQAAKTHRDGATSCYVRDPAGTLISSFIIPPFHPPSTAVDPPARTVTHEQIDSLPRFVTLVTQNRRKFMKFSGVCMCLVSLVLLVAGCGDDESETEVTGTESGSEEVGTEEGDESGEGSESSEESEGDATEPEEESDTEDGEADAETEEDPEPFETTGLTPGELTAIELVEIPSAHGERLSAFSFEADSQ